MTPFTENNRFDYPAFTKDSWVLDIGAHCGKSAKILADKYGCRVISYEPVKEFYDQIVALLKREPVLQSLIMPVNAGIGATERDEIMGVQGDLSGIMCAGNRKETVKIVSIDKVIPLWMEILGSAPSLLMINAENMEYEILEAMLDNGLESFFQFLQVQPHGGVPRAAERWAAIRNRLLMNFRITSEDKDLGTGWLLMERK